ncbi:MAG: adenylate/guanylate cyclase domain-containing protein [Ferruginibacter sp.]|nr:adenylate/guanylate cyclase domain-containing protein [Cytophagales bacterium]
MMQEKEQKTDVSFGFLIQDDATCHPGANQPVVQQHQLALFFLDIRDFTPFIASRSVLEVMHLLQQLFAIFRPAIQAHQGRIIETAGDGLYAVFGLEDTFEKAPSSALRAGLAILEGLAQANEAFFGPCFNHHFQVGIGLHVGQVIVGQLGLGVNNNPTVMGYPVNVASRLQAATKRLNNSFIVSEEAFKLLVDPPLAACEWIDLKGIPAPLKVHLLGSPYDSAFCHESAWLMAS